VLLLALIASASAFAPTLSSLTGRQARQRACFSGLRMQKDDNSEREYPKFEPDMSLLNSRISKLKERESNPLNRLQDTVADQIEDASKETKKTVTKLQNNIPVPAFSVPSTLPKWVVPLSVIVGLSVLTTLIQTQQTYNGAGLASGSL